MRTRRSFVSRQLCDSPFIKMSIDLIAEKNSVKAQGILRALVSSLHYEANMVSPNLLEFSSDPVALFREILRPHV